MDRPEKIYLDEPIMLYGIEVKHTDAGLQYLVEHFKAVVANAGPPRMPTEIRQHYEKLIENYLIRIALYERLKTEAV